MKLFVWIAEKISEQSESSKISQELAFHTNMK